MMSGMAAHKRVAKLRRCGEKDRLKHIADRTNTHTVQFRYYTDVGRVKKLDRGCLS